MRTTLTIDDDVLMAARELAAAERRSVGVVLSELARSALVSKPGAAPESHYGFRPLPHRAGVVTNELIDRLRDEEGI